MADVTRVTTVYTSNPQPAQYVSQPVQISTVREHTTFLAENVTACKQNGGFQAILGIFCIIFGIVSICLDCYYSDIATAIWVGFWFMVAGGSGRKVAIYRGVMAQRSLSRFMWMSTVAIVLAIMLCILMCVAISYEDSYNYDTYRLYKQRVAMESVILSLSFLEILAAGRGMGISQKTLREARRQTTVITQPGTVTVPVPNGPGYPNNVGGTYAYQTDYGGSAVHPPPPPPQYGFVHPQQPGPPTTPQPPGYGTIDSKPPTY
ncbi:uncharacterized protein [Apostichopus japonicus]